MAILGRTYSQSHLQRPQVVFAPAAPTQQQQTIKVVRFAADSRRRSEVRRFPPQWMESATIKETGFSTAGLRGAFERAIGPDPPQVIKALPPQWLQTIKVALAAQHRVVTERRRFPLQGWGSQVAFRSTTGTSEYDLLQRADPARRLGPRPPTRYLAVPSQRSQTLAVALAAQHRRRTEVRRFPLQGWSGALTRVSALSDGGTQTLPLTKPLLGVRPPQLVTPLPTQRQQTILVSYQQARENRLSRVRRGPNSDLAKPAVVTPIPVFIAEPVTVTLVKARPRKTVWLLGSPEALQTFPGPSVKVVRARPQPTQFAVGAPLLTTQTPTYQQATIAASLARIRPRRTSWFLNEPTVVSAAVAAGIAPPIMVRLAGRTRLDAQRRAPHAHLQPPFFYTATSEISVTLAGRTRVEAQRRAPHSKLQPPAILQVFPGPVETEVAVSRLIEQRRHAPHSFLGEPTVIRVPSVEQQEQTIRVALAGRTRTEASRRAPHSQYLKAATYPATSEIAVTFAGRTRAEAQRRAPHSRLYPPTTLQTFAGPLEEEIAVKTPLERPRRLAHFKLSLPTVVIPLPALKQQTVSVTLAGRTRVEAGRRAPHSKNIAPFFYPATSKITVWLAGRTRLEQTKRAPHARLAPPTTLQEFIGPVETEVSVRTLIEQRRHAPHSRLSPPTVIRVPSVEQQEQTIRVVLAGRTRIETIRRGPHSRYLNVVTYPATSEIAVSLAGRTRLEAQRRAPRSRLAPPAALQVFLGPSVTFAAIRTRAEQKRHFPLPGYAQQLIRETGAGASVIEVGFMPFLGVRPPTIIGPLPNLQQQSIRVALAALRTGLEQKRHFPLQGQTGQLVRETGAGTSVIQSLRKPILGIKPPTIIGPLPDLKQQTATTRLVALQTMVEAQRRAPHSNLSAPAAVVAAPPTQAQQTITILTAAVRTAVEQQRHAPRSRQIGPNSYPATSEIGVTLAGRTRSEVERRAPHSLLSLPAVLRVFAGPVETEIAVRTLVEQRRHAPHSKLSPPTVVRVPSIEQAEDTIRVTLAWRSRIELQRRAPHFELQPPFFYPATSEIGVTFAGQTRLDARRRAPHSRLQPPAIVSQQPTQRQSTILASLAAITTREVLLRKPKSSLPVVIPPAIARPIEEELRISLAAESLALHRRVRSFLTPPTVLAPVGEQITALSGLRRALDFLRRRGRSILRPPAVVTPAPTQQAQTITVVLAGRTRLEDVRRSPHSKLQPPAIFKPKSPETAHVQATLAGRTRLEAQRRAPHSHLAPPPPGLPKQSLPCFEVGKLRTRWHVAGPIVRWTVSPPTVLLQWKPRGILLRWQTAGIRTRWRTGRPGC